MKKAKLTRSLMAAVSIVALSAVMYGCTHDGDDPPATEMMPVDTDGDGVADADDAFPNDPDETADSDEDGVGDNADAFPDDPAETADSDGDGVGDNADAHNVPNDRDNDGVADSGDDFPDDPSETRDSDEDGVGDNADAFPLDPDETADSDGDGVGDNAQAEAEAAARVTKVTKEAETKLAAIGDIVAANGLGGQAATDAGTGAGAYSLDIKRDRDGTTVTVSVQEGAAADPDEDEKFMLAMDLGGGNTMLTRTMDADDDGNVVTEVAIISTDIEAPKATAFAMVAGQELNARDLDSGEDADGDGTSTNDFTALTVVAGTDDANLPLIMSSAFRSSTQAVLSFDFDDTSTATMDEADEVRGTYNGAPGTYRCNGTALCTVNIDSEGEISGIGTGWVFTPDEEDATSDVADAAYLSYGFWLKKTTDADGVVTYDEIAPFAMANGMVATTGTVTGKAEYEGGATGVYVHNELSEGGGTIESRTAGHFTAEASLMAYFGEDDEVAAVKHNTVTGTIDSFMLSGGEDQDWSVALKGGIDTTAFSITDGTANGGGTEGSLSGQFYGEADTLPAAVTGEFNANFSNGSVAGAFGAEK
ncbi:MAG: hypothetical protein OXP75_02990 [Rhodospirillales bacterium]|nr:hypothetical protein [Rhodospirillales bacterium]